jgi:hypothetical protein
MPLHYYTCIDRDPALDAHLTNSYGFIDAFSILLHGFIKIRIVCHNKKVVGLWSFTVILKTDLFLKNEFYFYSV